VGVIDAGGSVAVSMELTSNGIAVGTAVGGISDSPRSLVKKIHAIPRIETAPTTMGIKSSRLNEGRGCIA
jgi:hypothetical protein